MKSDSILATERALLPSSSQRGLNVTVVQGRRRAAKEGGRRGQFLFIASYKYGIN